MRATKPTTSRCITLASALLLSCAAGLSVPVMAGPQGCDQPALAGHMDGARADKRMQHLTRALSLTDEQVSQIKALNDAEKDDRKAARAALNDQRKAFHELAKAGASEAELQAQADVIAAGASAHMVAKSLHMQAVRALLTPEQQVKMDALPAHHKKGKWHVRSAE